MPVVAAVAIHNIPEGIAVSTPVFFATGSRSKAFWYSFLSGLAEPLGAIAGYLMLMPILNETVFGVLYGAVAGIMLYIALAELLPSAHEQSPKKFAVNAGLVAGMLIMAISDFVYVNATKNAAEAARFVFKFIFSNYVDLAGAHGFYGVSVPLGSDSRAAAFHDVYFRFG